MNDPKHLGRLLRLDQACERLAVSRATLYRLIGDGRLTALKIRGSLRVPEGSLEALIRQEIERFQRERM